MPVQIGATTHNFTDPTGLLSDCHRRVEMFMGSLKAVADLVDQQMTPDVRRSLALSLRYFREAAPKHTADEEVSLFPLLRKIANQELQDALAYLDALEVDHRWAEPLHAQVDLLGTRYLEQGKLSVEDAKNFRDAVYRLDEMYRRHIEVEDTKVFPVAARVLSENQKQEIAQQMAARRNVKPVQL